MTVPFPRSAVVLAGLALAGCSNAGEDLGFGLPTQGAVAAVVYFDRDATGDVTSVDTSVAGVTTYLLVAGTNDTVASGTTDASGLVTFTSVPVGTYAVRVAAQTLGDSLFTTLTPASVSVTAQGPTPVQQAAMAFPVLTVQEIRQAPVGRRVAVAGLILAGRQSFADTSVHMEDSTGALRLLRATNRLGFPANAPGEQVRVTGTVAVSGGQPVLNPAFVTTVGAPVALTLDTISTQEAATAGGGARDADLVFVPAGQVVDTATVGTAYRIRMDDGSGVLDLLFDLPAGFPALTGVVPGDSIDAGGVLVPAGVGVWQLKPRAAGDIRIF